MTDETTNDSFDERLRSGLHRRSREVLPEQDFDSVARRAARVDSRQRRALVVALVVALAAGPALGFVLGRGTSDDTQTAAGDTSDDSSGDNTPTTAAEQAASDDSDSPARAVPERAVPFGAGAAEGLDAVGGLTSGDSTAFGYAPESLERVALRTTADGTAIRIYRADYGDAVYEAQAPPWAPDWQPTGVCQPSGSAQVGFSTELAVGQGSHELWPELAAASAGQGAFGIAEGDPQWYVIAQTTPDVASVRATFSSGATDETAPVEGIAVLVGSAGDVSADGTPDAWIPQGTVELLDGSGGVLQSIPLGEELWSLGDPWSSDDFQARCTPPPPPPVPLPAAGEQPADVAAASAAVNEAFSTVFDGSLTPEDREPYIDDPTGAVAAARQDAVDAFPDLVPRSSAEVKELVFTAPDVAAVRYDLNVENYSTFADRYGEARLIDGTWKVTAPTVCATLTLATAGCDGVEPYPQPDPYEPYYDELEAREAELAAEAEVSSGSSQVQPLIVDED